MDLCQNCDKFVLALCIQSHQHTDPSYRRSWIPFTFAEDTERSRLCPLCRLVGYNWARLGYNRGTVLNRSALSSYKTTEGKAMLQISHPQDLKSRTTGIAFRIQPHNNPLILAHFRATIWARPDSPAAASGLMGWDPPLPSDNCSEAFALYRTWFQTCRQNHKLCNQTLGATFIDDDIGPRLPTRILDLGGSGATDLVLIETNGLSGNYCALSYCWGSPGIQTVTTTQENLKQRLSSIRLNSMPKTHQDAVQITRQLSVRYLWIDALCIIQDDQEDWARESKQMGSVYQMACLVIAASGATNPQEGCFVSTPRDLSSVELPFYSSTGQISGSFYISIFSSENPSPARGHLCTRGWTLQESYLARRTLRFMPGGPSWSCHDEHLSPSWGIDERDIAFEGEEFVEWDAVLERFSRMKLTNKSDRLMALQGIATILQELNGDTYNRGVFLSELAVHLLWMSCDIAEESEDLNDVPSWSWASKGVEKRFWCGTISNLRPDIDQTKVHINDQGCFRLQGNVMKCTAHKTAPDIKSFNCPRTHALFLVLNSGVHDPQSVVRLEGNSPQCTGVAVFDRQRFDHIYCLFLASTTLENFASLSGLTPAPELTRSGIQDVHLVLLLVPVPEKVECYQRVGMGMTLNELQPDDQSLFRTIDIV